jgi:putative Mg2+ transporter-C (MgtC) family protein
LARRLAANVPDPAGTGAGSGAAPDRAISAGAHSAFGRDAVNVPDWEVAVRLLVAAALGGLIGIQREADGQAAGLRTHMLLSLGAALFAVISVDGFSSFLTDDRSSTNVVVDPGCVASYVAAGVGFLGGGTIVKRPEDGTVKGLTTAASLWVAAAIGVACGLGVWIAPIVAVAIALLSLAVLEPLGRLIGKK